MTKLELGGEEDRKALGEDASKSNIKDEEEVGRDLPYVRTCALMSVSSQSYIRDAAAYLRDMILDGKMIKIEQLSTE